MLPLRVAIRYLLSGKAHAATGIITVIATIGIAVTTAALVVVLSVFNGFRNIITDRLSLLDPEVSVVAASGKTIADANRVLASVAAVPGVELAVPVVEDKALAVHGGLQTNVLVKGVPDGYDRLNSVRSLMVDGEWSLPRPLLKEGCQGSLNRRLPSFRRGGGRLSHHYAARHLAHSGSARHHRGDEFTTRGHHCGHLQGASGACP